MEKYFIITLFKQGEKSIIVHTIECKTFEQAQLIYENIPNIAQGFEVCLCIENASGIFERMCKGH